MPTQIFIFFEEDIFSGWKKKKSEASLFTI